MDEADALTAGLKHHQAGRLAQAQACYRNVLAGDPDHADALHLLGVIAQQSGRHDVAAELIGQAIKQNGQNAVYFCSLGVALYNQGNLNGALASYDRAISLRPDYVEAIYNRGNVLRVLRRFEEAWRATNSRFRCCLTMPKRLIIAASPCMT